MKLKTIYTPYTYFIGWSKENVYYYGARYAKLSKCLYASGCHPDDFWKTYFTSSKLVHTARNKYGEPDIKQIRKTFTTADEAICWETKVLNKLNVLNSSKWLNENVAGGLSQKVYRDLKEIIEKPLEVRVYGVKQPLIFKSRKDMIQDTGLPGTMIYKKLLKDGYYWVRRRKDTKHIFSNNTLLYLPYLSTRIDEIYNRGCTPLGKPSHTRLLS